VESKKLIYTIKKEENNISNLKNILLDHPEIQFVSFMGVDLGGNATDEKIPVKSFIKDADNLLNNGIQTDGSSVALNKIATLNNARVDIAPDLNANWFVDYNYEHIYEENNLPVGTLKIPSFLIHNGKKVDSRSILQKAVENFKKSLLEIFEQYPHMIKNIGIESVGCIEEIILTSATELELWVQTPEFRPNVQKLTTSQYLKEQYWKRTRGTVRTALEKSLMVLEKYGFEPEMGHKEVGGIASKVGTDGHLHYVMEQLEIDWKYSTGIQTADNELIIRDLVEEIFTQHGLQVSFAAKPIEEVVGNGEHTHVGISVKLKDGSKRNLFTPLNRTKDYLTEIGYGALMGILKNYEVINPFITSSTDGFNRLKPGFEAPVCIVSSLGRSIDEPSRNRTVLVGVVGDVQNPFSTRFEVRSPNPLSNTYLVISSIYQGMLDGIKAVAESRKNTIELEAEISKSPEAEGFYLEKGRAYRSEEDVFEYYTEEVRNRIFGNPPSTVWENIKNLDMQKNKKQVLLRGEVFTSEIIDSYQDSILRRWLTELTDKIIVNDIKVIKNIKRIHEEDTASDLDIARWKDVDEIRNRLSKNSVSKRCMFSQIRDAIENRDYDTVSKIQQLIEKDMRRLKILYNKYKKNLLEIEE